MKDLFRQKRRYAYLGHLCRRAVALVLALALVAPMTSAFAAPTDPDIVLPHPLEAGEEPTITIEANAVVNRWYDKAMGDPSDYLTGDLEVAIRVKSGEVNGTLQPFNTLGVALDYSPILTPYSWTLIDGIDLSGEDLSGMTAEQRVAYKTATAQPVSLNGTKEFEEMTSMQTLKSKKITAAVAHVSGTTEKDAEGNITAVKDGHLYMMAQADRPVVLKKDTVLAVVTFKYDVENIKILASQAPDWYQWLVDTGTSTAAEGDEGDGTGGDGTGDTGGTTTGGVAPEDHWLVRLTTIADTNESYYGGREVRYDSEDNSMYHSATRQPLPAGWDNTTTPATQKTVDNYIELNKDVTKKVDHQVNFALVNQTTYNDGGLTLDDLATVLFYDWDDTLIGVLVIPRNGDARKLVNDYVRDHMIHPDLHGNTNYGSVLRRDNYRGIYPYSGPAGENDTFENGAAGTVGNGEKYALTNKLDYVFFKRTMERDEKDPNKWVEVSPVSGETDPYPYIHGWAVIPDDDFSDNQYTHPKTLWTTMGVGELSSYVGMDDNKTPISAEVTCEDPGFEFADFNFSKHSLNKAGSVYAVKAIYEPGKDLLATDYSILGEATYSRYTYSASTSNGGATYAAEYQYGRIATSEGARYGVVRSREPVVRVEFVPDVASLGFRKGDLDSIFSEIEVENKDVIDVKITPPASVVAIDYTLIDRYGLNFMVGSKFSTNGDDRTMVVPDSFNYDQFKYDNRLGSEGLIYFATINTLLSEGIKAVDGKPNYLFNHWSMETINDLNLRKNMSGSNYLSFEVAGAMTTFTDMISAARAAGCSDSQIMNLTWHQIQYYFLHKTFVDADTAQNEQFLWCRWDDGCVGAEVTIVSDFETLMTAAYEAANGSFTSLNTLLSLGIVNNSPMYLRAGPDGETFGDLDDFKTQIVDVARNAGTPDLTWAQVQYALLHGNKLATGGEDTLAFQEDYWWYNGGQKVTDWDGFLVAIADAATSGRNAVLNTARGENLPKITHTLASAATEEPDGTYSAAQIYTDAEFTQLCTDLRGAMVQAGLVYIQNPTWDQVQYFLLEGVFDTNVDMNAHGATHYWWYDSGTLITDVPSLLGAVSNAKLGRTAALDQLTADQISGDPLYLRQDFAGTPYEGTEENLKKFKDAIANAPFTVTDWTTLQYYLIHGGYTVTDSETARNENTYYWWADGGSVTAPSIVANNVTSFVEAAFAKVYNGNDKAWDTLTEKKIADAYFRCPTQQQLDDMRTNKLEEFATLPKFTGESGVNTFKTKLESLVQTVLGPADPGASGYAHPHTPPALSWFQIQRYLVTGDYDSSISDDVLADTYWWSTGENGPNFEGKSDFEKLLGWMEDYQGGDSTGLDALTAEFLQSLSLRPSKTGTTFGPSQLATAIKNLKTLIDKNLAGTAISDLTWANIQYALLNKGKKGTAVYAWDPAAASAAFFMDGAGSSFGGLSYGETSIEWDEETGITVVTTVVETPVGDNILLVETITTIDPETNETTTVTITTLADYEGNVISTSETIPAGEDLAPVEKPEEPTCTCGSEDGTHNQDCPLYVAPETPTGAEEPICTCGGEDGTHNRDCPLYTQSEEPTDPEASAAPETSDKELTDPEVPGAETPTPDPGTETEPGFEPEVESEPELKPDPEPEKETVTTEIDNAALEVSTKLPTKTNKRIFLRLIALENLRIDSGGWKMNGIKMQKNISPPGRLMIRTPWLWSSVERGIAA